MVYTLKKYLKELKTNKDWEVEPHFYFYSMFKMLDYFRTASENKMTAEDLQSALYGQFDLEGKPIYEGFIKNFNLTIKLLNRIIETGNKALKSSPKSE